MGRVSRVTPSEDSQDETVERPRRAALKKHGPVLITVLLLAAGFYALYKLLAPLDFQEVLVSIRATPTHTYVLAISATVVAYCGLIGYDWSAIRYIGKRLPLPSIALGGFLGYAFGNTIGLSALSGGAVRYRIYTSLGLTGYDIAAISGFAAMAYGVGATLIGLGALALHPAALAGVTAIPPETLRPMAFVALLVLVGVILYGAARGACLRIGRFSIRAPSLGNVTAQFGFSLIDISAAAFALYVLLPSGDLNYITFLAVFAVATMIGVASHVPGGVGVFETVVIAALGSSVPLSDAVTGLLLFRLIYFLLPFVLAMILLSLSEIWMATGRGGAAYARIEPVIQAGQAIIPLAMGVLVLVSGLFMMFSGLLRNPVTVDTLGQVLPLVVIEGGALLSSIVGSALVVLALGLFRRSRVAFWLVLLALGVGIFAALLHGNDFDRVLILAAMMLLLLPCRREFYRAARLGQGALSGEWLLFTFAILASIGLIYFVVHRSGPYANAMWWQFSMEDEGPRALRAALTGGVVLTLALLVGAMRTRQLTSRAPDPEALAEAEAIISVHGTARDMLALSGDKRLMFASSGEGVLSYAERGASWVALGAPVGTAEACETLAWAFHDAARAAGARPVLYEAPERFQHQSVEIGLALHRMGNEAVVSLRDSKLLSGHDDAVELWHPPHSEARIAELRRVSEAWLGARGGRERRFAFGRFEPEYLNRFPVAVLRGAEGVLAFASLPVTRGPAPSAAVDLLRAHPDAPAEAVDHLLGGLIVRLAAAGYVELSLGITPLVGQGHARASDVWDRFAALVYRGGDGLSEVEELRRSRSRFASELRPRYLCCRSILEPVAPLADVAVLIVGSAGGLGRK